MCLPVDSEQLPAVEHGNRIVQHRFRLFIEAHRHHYSQFFRHLEEKFHSIIFLCRLRIIIIIILSFLAEILPFKELRQQHYIGAVRCGLPHHVVRMPDIFCHIPAAVHLNRSCCYLFHIVPPFSYSGICCVMQWIFPPPSSTGIVFIGYIFLSGKSACRISTAALSFSSPNCGMITPPFDI